MHTCKYISYQGVLKYLDFMRVDEEGKVEVLTRNGYTQRPRWNHQALYTTKNGSTYVRKKMKGKAFMYAYGRLVYHSFIDCSTTYMHTIEHINGDKRDARLENLRLGPIANNMIQAIKVHREAEEKYSWYKNAQIVLSKIDQERDRERVMI